jgi:hypothetical protein
MAKHDNTCLFQLIEDIVKSASRLGGNLAPGISSANRSLDRLDYG